MNFSPIKFTKIYSTFPLNFIMVVAILLVFTSCDNDDEDTISYDIPTTYNFENVSYSGQIQRISMLLEMKNYMATSRTAGSTLDGAKLKAMFANDAANAGWEGSYEDSKQIKSKTFESVQADFETLMDEIAIASQSTVPGSEGQSGVIEKLDGSGSYLVGDDGLDHAQLIEKGLMGACFYYQATAVYMGEDRMNVDNEIIIPGEGTDMEHHWDEAFGYLGVPKDFPTNTDALFFWGSYANKRNALLDSNEKIMDALLKGRAAITNKDLETRDEAIMEAREIWELISVGSALHYLNDGIANFDDMAIRSHSLSEAIAFTYCLIFNPDKTIDNTQIDQILELIAGSADFSSMNLYQTDVSKLQQAKDLLADYYNLADMKDEF